MRLDSQLSFVPLGSPLSLVAAAGVAIASPVTIDMLGLGVGVAPTQVIWGNSAVFGTDMGIGAFRPELEVTIGTACATANSATLNVQLQAAPDPGAAGSYTPTTWTTLVETGAIALTNLTANAQIARLPWLPAVPPGLRPRFLRLNFVVPAATNFTAGTIAFALVTFVRDDLAQKYAVRNYTVA